MEELYKLILPPIHHTFLIYFLDIIHLLLLICILLLIYKLKQSQVGSYLIRLNARIIHINFFIIFNNTQLKILKIK